MLTDLSLLQVFEILVKVKSATETISLEDSDTAQTIFDILEARVKHLKIPVDSSTLELENNLNDRFEELASARPTAAEFLSQVKALLDGIIQPKRTNIIQ